MPATIKRKVYKMLDATDLENIRGIVKEEIQKAKEPSPVSVKTDKKEKVKNEL